MGYHFLIFLIHSCKFCYSELSISRPDSRRTILNAASHDRSNDANAIERRVILRKMGYIKGLVASNANLRRTLRLFGANFDFVDFGSVRAIFNISTTANYSIDYE